MYYYCVKTNKSFLDNNEMAESIEKLCFQPKDLFEAVDFTDLGVVEGEKEAIPHLIEGETYSLQGVSCDGFDMKEKVYKVIKIVNDFYDVPINSVIVKQIKGDMGKIYTLSKNDCLHHNIEYEEGLQIFPKSLPWVRVKEKESVPFDPYNLGTTPLSEIDNTIRYIVLKLKGFKDYTDGYILTPSEHLVKENDFINSLRITPTNPIIYGNGTVIQENIKLRTKIVYPKTKTFNHGNFITSDNEIYVLITLVKRLPKESNPSSINRYIGEFFGIEKKYLENINPNNLFNIAWNELGAYTIDEYEALKAKRKKAEEEKIRRIEEKRKRKIAEEEKRQIEKQLHTEEAVRRMKSIDFSIPPMPEVPKLKFSDRIIPSFEAIDEILNPYFKDIDGILDNYDRKFGQLVQVLNKI